MDPHNHQQLYTNQNSILNYFPNSVQRSEQGEADPPVPAENAPRVDDFNPRQESEGDQHHAAPEGEQASPAEMAPDADDAQEEGELEVSEENFQSGEGDLPNEDEDAEMMPAAQEDES